MKILSDIACNLNWIKIEWNWIQIHFKLNWIEIPKLNLKFKSKLDCIYIELNWIEFNQIIKSHILIYFFIFVIICQNFCSLCSGGNLIKHIFSFKSTEFFIMPLSCCTSVSPLNFWHVFTLRELYVLVKGITKIGPALSYHLVRPCFGNALNLGSTH
jgi:hypothetical protein